MNLEKRYRKLIFIIIIFCLSLNCYRFNCHAETPAVKIRGGEIIFTTKDTTASNLTTWGTVGFSITRDPCRKGSTNNGGDPWKLPHAVFWITDEMKIQDSSGHGTTYVNFIIPEKVVTKALQKKGFEGIKENDMLYLHTIFQVYYSGTPHGGKLHSYSGITNAEKWRNPHDFDDRFDIPVEYHSNVQPVTILYIDGNGALIKSAKMDEVIPGEKTEVTLDKTVDYKGKTLYICKSYIQKQCTGKRIKDTTHWVTSVTSKSYQQQLKDKKILEREHKQVVGGIVYVARMVEKRKAEGKSVNVVNPQPAGIIAADERDNELFDVAEGIPTTEQLYTNIITSKYLMGYVFQQVMGKKSYRVLVSKTYHLSWEVVDPKTMKKVKKTDSKTVTQDVNIYRYYSYWYIKNLEYYKLDHGTIYNYALPGGVTSMNPVDYTIPELTYIHSNLEDEHLIEPMVQSISIPSEKINGEHLPVEDFTEVANNKIKEIKVRNDRLEFDGTIIMDNNYVDKDAKEPLDMEIEYEDIWEDTLYKSGQTIDAGKANGTYTSTGTVTYKPVKTIDSRISGTPIFSVNDLSKVIIHTPTVCDAYISNQNNNNQMINPDKTRSSLILDTTFFVLLPTFGGHRFINGYGYQDYDKYIQQRQVKFPFDIYHGKSYTPSGTWITLSTDVTPFYLPIWVKEDNYTIEFRSISINTYANNTSNQTEAIANLSVSNYVATDTINVHVSGRIYGLQLYDISDYPIWEAVFRMPKSLNLTGFNYTVGTKNQNGVNTNRNEKYTLALLNGSHPTLDKVGALKTGYVTRFHLTTIGNMYSSRDYVWIRPRFYYVSSNGENKREVDLYYTETFSGKKQVLVKAGSLLDQQNKKALQLGDAYLTVPEFEIITKAAVSGISLKEVKETKKNIFTFTNILIPETLRTYIGINYSPTKTIPFGVDPDLVTKSMQKWYGEYYLPSEIHVVSKGFQVEEYSEKFGGIDYQEDFWLKNGYIIVNFEIETIQNGVRHLSYLNLGNAAGGYCNMWKKEGYQYLKKDNAGNKFDLADGDMYLYFSEKSASRDYKAGGTH